MAPIDFVPLQFVPSGNEGKFLVFGRNLISGQNNLQIFDPANKDWTYLELSYEERTNYFFQGAFNVGDQIFMFVYDVVRNTPSGRRISGLSQGLDLYQVSITDSKIELTAEKRALPLGGLYVNIFSADQNSSKIICAQKACLNITPGEGGFIYQLIENEYWVGKSLLELASDGEKAFGLFRIDFDDRLTGMPKPEDPVFFICPIDVQKPCTSVKADVIPYKLQVTSGNPVYSRASEASDYGEIFRFDLERMPRSGIANLGNNNMEGTIPWNQVYALNALVDIASGQVNLGQKSSDLVERAKERLDIELSLMAKLGRTRYPWFYTKRYSLDREPISSLVHIGRIVRLFSRAKNVADIEKYQDVLCDLTAEILSPERAVETLQNTPGKRPEMRISRYYPFWADGGNVPWNYQSSWIDGILYGQECATNAEISTFASTLITMFINEENLASLPKIWNYARGDILDGWVEKDNISSNTPNWAGDKQNTTTAHISYRSMDAMALLAAQRFGLSELPDGFVNHILQLVEEGWLYPFVAEELLPLNERPKLPFATARLYSRAALSWEFQNQIWALDALIRQTNQQ